MSTSTTPKDKKEEAPKPPSRAKGRILSAVGFVLIVAVSSVAGAALSPIIGARLAPPPPAAKVASRPHAEDKPLDAKEAAAEAEEEGEDGDKKKGEAHGLLTLDAMVVDLRDLEGETHHVKIGLALELNAELPEEEGKIFVVRGRDAAITYLRTLSYEEVTDHARFETIRSELASRVVRAFGKTRAKKMLITEYVVQ